MASRSFIDQLKTNVKLKLPAKRIISLVPSQTELLFDLGLGERVVGITKFCVHPLEWKNSKTIIGGTKKFNFDAIQNLKPDLIIGNKEENYEEGINKLRALYPVWMSDIYSLEDAISMISSIAEITEMETQGIQLLHEIEKSFAKLPVIQARAVLYLIWKEPWMAVGQNTFIDALIKKIGWKNVISESRYPELAMEDVQDLNPEVVLLSTEPYPFNEQHRIGLQRIIPSAKVLVVDGEMFSWYGSRLIKAPAYFKEVISLIA